VALRVSVRAPDQYGHVKEAAAFQTAAPSKMGSTVMMRCVGRITSTRLSMGDRVSITNRRGLGWARQRHVFSRVSQSGS